MNFKRHFPILAVAFAALLLYRRLPAAHDLPLIDFALYGALHALCVVLALDASARRWQRALLIAFATLADVAMLYLGIFAVGLFGGLPAAVVFLAPVGICALAGALTYGLLLRATLFPSLRPRYIAQLALGCMAASMAGAALLLHGPADVVWLVGIWWLAFSCGLWLVQRRCQALAPRAANQVARDASGRAGFLP